MTDRARAPNQDWLDVEIPGLNSNAPVNEQIELIDQLVTLKLQNIDAIFADIHNIIISQVLPSIKKYSQNTQPVREAAHFWKTFFEVAANVKVPTSEADADLDSTLDPERTEETVEREESRQTDATEPQEAFEEPSFAHDHTPTNVSFNPAVASTPAGPLHGRPEKDVDTTTTSSVNLTFPVFSESDITSTRDDSYQASRYQSRSFTREPETSRATSDASSFGIKGKEKASEAGSSTFSNIFSNTPSPRKAIPKSKAPLRENLLRQNFQQAVTPKRQPPQNPFQPSSSKTPWNGIVDLANYSPTSDSSVSFGFSPEAKKKYFSTPQYKLMRKTTEEAVDIQMAEVKARLPSETSQESINLPTPMSAAKRSRLLKQARERQSLADPSRFKSHLLRDDGDSGEFDDDDSSDESSVGIIMPSYDGVDDDSDSDSDFGFNGDESGIPNPPQAQIYNSDSGSSSGHDNVRHDPEDDNDDDDEDPRWNLPQHNDDGDTSRVGGFTNDSSERTGPTETLFGKRPADRQISAAEFARNLARPLGARVLPHVQPDDSPTPALGAPAGHRPAGPSKLRK